MRFEVYCMLHKKETFSETYAASIYKLIIFASIISVEMIIGYTTSNDDYTMFYLTVLCQSFSNFYDASTFLNDKYVFKILIRSICIMFSSVLAVCISICYLVTKNYNSIYNILNNVYCIIFVVLLISSILIFLVEDCVKHVIILHNIEELPLNENDDDEFLSMHQTNYHFYTHGTNDELDSFPDICLNDKECLI